MCFNSTSRLILQWHLTAKCNQRCRHCYQEKYYGNELSFDDIVFVIKQYKELLLKYAAENKTSFIRGHINITGGEPFIREDIFDILNEFYKNKDFFSYGILTNGSFIDNEVAKRIKKLNVAHVQVSIDGKRSTHDKIRGKGNFDKTWDAVRILRKNNIRTMVSFTAHKMNYKEFPIVANYARLNKASKLWSDRLVPMGNNEEMNKQILNKDEALEYFRILNNEKNKEIFNKISGLEISNNRALQFLGSGENPYSCSAGNSLITILENGDVVPCRRMPIQSGENIKTSTLSDIYFNNQVFKDLRGEYTPDKCKKCNYSNKCKGGLKCVSYALYDDYTIADPCCPIINN